MRPAAALAALAVLAVVLARASTMRVLHVPSTVPAALSDAVACLVSDSLSDACGELLVALRAPDTAAHRSVFATDWSCQPPSGAPCVAARALVLEVQAAPSLERARDVLLRAAADVSAGSARERQALFLLAARVLALQHDLQGALAAVERGVRVLPVGDEAEAARSQPLPSLWVFYGWLLRAFGRNADSAHAYAIALHAGPLSASQLNDMGSAMLGVGNRGAALQLFERAVALDPQHSGAWNNLGITRHDFNDIRGAVSALEQALHARRDFAVAWFNYANALAAGGLVNDSIAAYSEAIFHDKTLYRAFVNRAYYRQHMADWTHREYEMRIIRTMIRRGDSKYLDSIQAFQALMLPLSGHERLIVARHHAERYARLAATQAVPFRSYAPVRPAPRLRIGYLSGDVGDHITARLMSGVYAAHDRARFDVTVYSTSPLAAPGSGRDAGECELVARSVDRVVDLSAVDAAGAARRIHDDALALLVQLDGHTHRNRLDISALRPAARQVMHLGYPGTTGASYVQHFVADRVVVPPQHAVRAFTEHMIYLPHSYQFNAHRQRFSALPLPPSRDELLGPSAAQRVVFCDLNQLYKIDAEVLDLWSRVLHGAPHSIIWLLRNPAAAEANVRALLERRGIDAERIVFTNQTTDADEFVALFEHCDVFLDTLLCNAHATASDALWQGVPLVTLPGRTMTQRVAASLLAALGMHELIAESGDHYVRVAVALANSPSLLASTRARLRRAVEEMPLFDAIAQARAFEAAAIMLYDARGAPHIVVAGGG